MAKYFSAQSNKIVFSISHYKMVIRFNVLQQTAYLVVNPIMVILLSSLITCWPVGPQTL